MLGERCGIPRPSWVENSIVSARDGSYTALGRLLDHYRDYLLRVANQELASDLAVKVAPSDLVQETFLAAAQGFPCFAGKSEEELRAWLRQILSNKIHNAFRQFQVTEMRRLTRETPLADCDEPLPSPRSHGADSPPLQLERVERLTRLAAAIERLEGDDRRVIELRSFDDLPFEEVGRRLDRSADAARKLWKRAVDRLIAELAEHDQAVR